MSQFKLQSKFPPAGDQPKAIDFLTDGLVNEVKEQTLLGITGSGKTYTMANVIQNTQKPTLILSHNKTLAAQLFSEFKEFFPENNVTYFVSYYDYYQPEAYVPRRDLYIEKEVDINKDIERYRSATTQKLLTSKDVIVVASVSCIYGLGNPEDYMNLSRTIKVGDIYDQTKLYIHLADMQYERLHSDFYEGTYRVRGDVIDIFTIGTESAIRLEFFGNEIEEIKIINPLTGEVLDKPKEVIIFPAKQYVTPYESLKTVIPKIRDDLDKEVAYFKKQNRLIEAERLRQRVNYDLEMLQETGYVSGIENYSRYIENRPIGSPPSTLLDYFTGDWLLMVDESHITLPQVRGMYNGDQARKQNLVDFGFRMRAALDNRPLKFEEFVKKLNQVVYVSATPSEYEMKNSNKNLPKFRDTNIVEQIIRPTGLLDPNVDIRPSESQYLDGLKKHIKKHNYTEMTYFNDGKKEAFNQIDDLMNEIDNQLKKGERTIVLTLTKRMAEDLSKFLIEKGIKTAYLHSEIDTIERVEILNSLRKGIYDVVVGINLLREGIDLPEVSLVALIDADKEGFLRSEVSLIQIMGRASRHVNGKVIMYADKITDSMKKAIDTILARRKVQIKYNKKHGIEPQTIIKEIKSQLERTETDEKNTFKQDDLFKKAESYPAMSKKGQKEYVAQLKLQMDIYADMMEYEKAAEVRDLLAELNAI